MAERPPGQPKRAAIAGELPVTSPSWPRLEIAERAIPFPADSGTERRRGGAPSDRLADRADGGASLRWPAACWPAAAPLPTEWSDGGAREPPPDGRGGLRLEPCARQSPPIARPGLFSPGVDRQCRHDRLELDLLGLEPSTSCAFATAAEPLDRYPTPAIAASGLSPEGGIAVLSSTERKGHSVLHGAISTTREADFYLLPPRSPAPRSHVGSRATRPVDNLAPNRQNS